ncbi:hypothetical protein Vadar_030797 [Vaccinium darrowii]|uniref:Uncharacterized protein n=1 Tax=Vaccinium darrowii TaxID=229202 RepID=A0ACB7X593_9ERIC|nr:hypothetical protein Vadar_030797 [Vaccinium darrowii]
MTAPNMATITASLERSLQNCSLNQISTSSSGSGRSRGGVGFSSSSDSTENQESHPSDSTLELNSQISLPFHWEQCLDLKTGEIYYINWRTGMKVKEDPRTAASAEFSGDFYSEYDSSYDSEGSSSESSPSSSITQPQNHHQQQYEGEQREEQQQQKNQVLVVAGCKGCLMYFMVPKEVGVCPKCCGQLLHFDRSESD